MKGRPALNRRRQPLRVAYILHRFPYLTETFILREMHWLRQGGIDVQIFSLLPPQHGVVHDRATEMLPDTHYSAMFSWEILAAQMHFFWRAPLRYLRSLANLVWQTYREPKVLLRALALFPKSVLFARRMKELEIDHIHAHFVWLEGLAAGVVKDLLDVTFSIHPHAFGLFGRNQRNVKKELENATRVVTVSEYHRAFIADLSSSIAPEDIQVVHYGIETDHFTPAAAPPSQPSRILSVGRPIEKKGHEYLIDACRRLAERGFDFQCEIVVGGSGGLRDALQHRIDRHRLTNQVRLLNMYGEDEIVELYRRSHVFALGCVVAASGDRDGLPNVLIEALACGLPVVTTPVAGIPELVEDMETGLLVPERDAVALADALERLLTDEDLRRHLGTRGRAAVQAGFEAKDNAAAMAAIFRRIVTGNGAPAPSVGSSRHASQTRSSGRRD